MKRKIIILTLLATLLLGGYAAAAGKYKTIKVYADQITLKLNGYFSDRKVEAISYNGTIYLPIRAIGEEMGGVVEWQSSNRTVSINFDRLLANSMYTASNYKLYQYMLIEKNQVMLKMIDLIQVNNFNGMIQQIKRLQALQKLANGMSDTELETIISQMAFSAEVIRSGLQSKKGDDYDFAVRIFMDKESEFNSHIAQKLIDLSVAPDSGQTAPE